MNQSGSTCELCGMWIDAYHYHAPAECMRKLSDRLAVQIKVREINERNIQETEARIERFRAKYAEVAPA